MLENDQKKEGGVNNLPDIFTLDKKNKKLFVGNKDTTLTDTQLVLFCLFYEDPNKFFTFEELQTLEEFKNKPIYVIAHHVVKLRNDIQKLRGYNSEDTGYLPKFWRDGYRFRPVKINTTFD